MHFVIALWRAPSEFFEEFQKVSADQLHQFAESFAHRMRRVTDAVEKLEANGWTGRNNGGFLEMHHPEARDEDDGKRVIAALGLDPSIVLIHVCTKKTPQKRKRKQ